MNLNDYLHLKVHLIAASFLWLAIFLSIANVAEADLSCEAACYDKYCHPDGSCDYGYSSCRSSCQEPPVTGGTGGAFKIDFSSIAVGSSRDELKIDDHGGCSWQGKKGMRLSFSPYPAVSNPWRGPWSLPWGNQWEIYSSELQKFVVRFTPENGGVGRQNQNLYEWYVIDGSPACMRTHTLTGVGVLFVAADISGDTLKDMIHIRTDNGELIFAPHLATGSGGFFKQPIYRTGVHYNGGENTLVTVVPADINGDGRKDLIHVRTNNGPGFEAGGELIFVLHLATGSGGFSKQPIYNTSNSRSLEISV